MTAGAGLFNIALILCALNSERILNMIKRNNHCVASDEFLGKQTLLVVSPPRR
ncbi:MAG: hypothetical protein V1701_12135 [Planctomycetota bacterium]